MSILSMNIRSIYERKIEVTKDEVLSDLNLV